MKSGGAFSSRKILFRNG